MVHNVKHTRIGLWDLYEDKAHAPARVRWPTDALPHVARMLTDVASIPACAPLLLALLALDLLIAIVPAIHLSYSGKLLGIVQTAVDQRTVDPELLVSVVVGSFLASVAKRLLPALRQRVSTPLNLRIKNYYSVHIFASMVRLDVPTFDDPAVQRQLEHSLPRNSHTSIAFTGVSTVLHVLTTAIQLVSQISVLQSILRNQPDGPLLAALSCTAAFFQWKSLHSSLLHDGVWVATTTNEDYKRAQGLKHTVNDPIHRKEIVASGIAPFLLAQYRETISRISDQAADFYELVDLKKDSLSPNILFQEFLRSLPEVVFVLRAVRQPTSIPLSLTSLHLITNTTQSFIDSAFNFVQQAGSISDRLGAVKQLYQIANIPNRVQVHTTKTNGDEPEDFRGIPFPENDRTFTHGISIEFSNVSFIYPGSASYALRHVSFKIQRGQLCVIVGSNGSGKSTILKLISRLYDPVEGTIYIDGIDIKTLRLADLRRAISVLFQDYTYFPLSIQDNIALGDPAHATDLSKIERAAQLGGADSFISRLPDKYSTYLEPPVKDHYSYQPEGTKGASGTYVDFSRVREAAGISMAEGGGGVGSRGISGGQMQRIALSRTFMRSVVSDQSVGLLLFDEPSASLDPTAEHDLFERLRMLRGNKTMLFSSHRFGNLTRHADLILYMNESVVVEEGTHVQLIKCNGEYARIWTLQAQAFL
ncbi:hypothetical protein HYPSUDRAFT_32429 [Hypholoma sublateritium FD-334 SS-4]|uniref:ABC transporter domain-containing protein n=1 Tax=Hypholoma sublateritium (strain FD-334 SS-4) TaxID=945553 RepID=A0A0D2LM75_HYPSF|nr:hypothetical protein HYPSUDRAFT_32429 [Hypholoma sublateritium FD-334 SS-4]